MAETLRSAQDGLLHLPGSTIGTFETACGACDTGTKYERSTGLPTCRECIDTARTIFGALSRKELSACLKTPN